ncbi:Mur ligase family protein [Candidatus Poriferisodalis sp.]|uniref:Mur ligase family protein n=1 Tax=Candidatus Poriferisodalis sp. TaxID=3101277 RepID=UPI003B52A243
MSQVVLWASVVAGVVAAARWLRVAQREHYGVGRTSRFARRWWLLDGTNRVLALIAAVGVVLSGSFWWAPAVTAAAVAVGPRGLPIRGRTSPLAWTRRVVTLAVTLALLCLVLIGVGLLAGLAPPIVAVLLFGLPLWVDVSLAILAPLEAVLSRRWVHRAQERLDRVDPVRVAVTGSYGKTTIKGYLRHLVEGSKAVVATPASFNNTAGICRSVNEHLVPGTEVFIAEMGTFAAGEIAAMTRWVRPSVSILASIGPVHLERFGSLDRIVAAKAEIFATSRTAILNIDAYGLRAEADRLAASGLRVIRCSTQDPRADVTVLPADVERDGPAATNGSSSGLRSDAPVAAHDVSINEAAVSRRITLFGREIAVGPLGGAAPANVACAVAAASVLGVSDADIASRLGDLPTPDHRRTAARSPTGVMVIDDTYNSNPAGARAALSMLANTDAARRVVVTPGMVELGRSQAHENRLLGEQAAQIADDVIIVGRTNRTALLGGAAGWDQATARRANRGRHMRNPIHGRTDDRATVRCMADLESAVSWVRTHLGAGDAVLYENDLPDHYP